MGEGGYEASAANVAAMPADRSARSSHPAPARGTIRQAALWFGLFGAPAAWSVQTLVNMPVAAHGCFPALEPLGQPVTAVRGLVFAMSVAAVLVCALAVAVALRSWMKTRDEHHGASGRNRGHATSTTALEMGEGRTRFMALAGVLTSVTFLIASVAHAATIFMVTPC